MTTDLTTQDLPATTNLDHPMSAGDLTRQALLIQEILDKVMVGPTPDNPQGIHYGIVPGTKKPTLLQPGAEKICSTFRLAPKYAVEDLSEPHNNLYRYRVTCSLYTIRDGLFVGAACGESSTAEEKYSWERVICQAQYDEADPSRRRVKFYRADQAEGGFERVNQIQRNAADLANTCLKIACKRAFVSATRGATAASDLLDVDLEEEAVADVARQQAEDTPKPKAKPKPSPSFAYGKFKGHQITDQEIPVDYLQFMADATAKSLDNPAKAKFKVQNQLFLAALDAEIAHRTAAPSQEAPKQPKEQAKSDPSEAQPSTPKDTTRQPMSDHGWADFITYCEEDAPAEYADVKKTFKVASGYDLVNEKRLGFYDMVNQLVAARTK